MRQIVLDTETTGLNVRSGDRIVEIGCIELLNRQFTCKDLHIYINPERASDKNALAVHGLTTQFLSDKPKFSEIVGEFLDYIQDAEIIIHNAVFDVSFLNAEFAALGLPPFTTYVSSVIDSLHIARELHPGRRNSLDALCDRYGIVNTHRTFHGGLLDAALLAEVYLAMTRGQNSLLTEIDAIVSTSSIKYTDTNAVSQTLSSIANVIIISANEDECRAHEEILDTIDLTLVDSACIWRRTM